MSTKVTYRIMVISIHDKLINDTSESELRLLCTTFSIFKLFIIRVITKLPNTEQSSKGKGRTHKSTNRQNQLTTENWENRNGPVQAFPKKWWIESDFTAPNLPLPLRLKGSGCQHFQ